jgi:hypothetical protein
LKSQAGRISSLFIFSFIHRRADTTSCHVTGVNEERLCLAKQCDVSGIPTRNGLQRLAYHRSLIKSFWKLYFYIVFFQNPVIFCSFFLPLDSTWVFKSFILTTTFKNKPHEHSSITYSRGVFNGILVKSSCMNVFSQLLVITTKVIMPCLCEKNEETSSTARP